MAKYYRVKFSEAEFWETAEIVTIRRNLFWPFSRNVTFGRTVFEGGPEGMNDPTMKHELTHVRQYLERGLLWVIFHPGQREAEARAAETANYPQWRAL